MAQVALGSIIPQLAFLDALVQDNTLARIFHDALYPELLYRMEAVPDKWAANLGQREIQTRSGLFGVDTDPVDAGADPLPENEAFEQWEVTAAQHGKSTDVNMSVSRTTLNSLFLRKAKNLGLNAGQTLNRLARNRLFCAYVGGHTIAETAASPDDFFEVASITGFQQQLLDGQLNPVSAANGKPFLINGVLSAETVIAVAPLDAAFPNGRGLVTTSGDVTVVAGDTIQAADAATVIRAGGGTSVDALATTDLLTLADVRRAVATLRRNRVPPHSDGYFHVHLDPLTESQLFADPEFRQLNESNYGDAPYQMFAVGKLLGCVFYTNSESPSDLNTGPLQVSRPVDEASARLGREIGAEVINAADVRILRTIVTGGGALYEKYVDESEYLSEAGYQGKIGGFGVVNNGIAIPIERIRYIVRAPQDRYQQQVSQTWSWTGDFGVPSDFLGGLTGARFKRGVVIESGQNV
jgi:hypothetical protein